MIITCPECKTDYRVASAALGPSGRKVKCRHCSHIWLTHASADANQGGEAVPAGGGSAESPRREEEAATAPAEEAAAAADQDDTLAEVKVDRSRDPEEAALREMLSGAGLAEKIGLDGDSRAGRRLVLRRNRRQTGARGRRARNPAVAVAAVAAALALLVAGALSARESVVRHLPGTARIFAALGYPVNLRGLEFQNVTFRTEIDNGVPVLAVSGDIVNVTARTVRVPDIRYSLRNATRHEVYHWTGRAQAGEVAPEARTGFLTRLASPPLAADHLQIHFVDPAPRRVSSRY